MIKIIIIFRQLRLKKLSVIRGERIHSYDDTIDGCIEF